MNSQTDKNESATADPWGSFEPYVQLVRSLMPRAMSVSLFDAGGIQRWSSETTTGPEVWAQMGHDVDAIEVTLLTELWSAAMGPVLYGAFTAVREAESQAFQGKDPETVAAAYRWRY